MLDYVLCVQPQVGMIVGPVIRYCGECELVLEGDVPQVGDRSRKEDAPPVMTDDERLSYLSTGYAPHGLYGGQR
jgi:hypothetical protein